MKLRTMLLGIGTGDAPIVVLNESDAVKLDLHYGDRVLIKKQGIDVVAIIDIAKNKKLVPKGRIAVFEEVASKLKCKGGEIVEVQPEGKPLSVSLIRKKMEGKELTPQEMSQIVRDIVENRLSESEISYFIAACYMRPTTLRETIALTKAMVESGETIKFEPPVFDLHCIGGVAGNRTTPIVVPIVAEAGLLIPKTSSRAITSPAGTADTIEVIANVSFGVDEIKSIVQKTGGCIVWGGAVSLAPADDTIIRLEYPLGIDSPSQMLASIIAKKKSVSATHVLIDIPVGKGAKVESVFEAKKLARMFVEIGKALDIKFEVMLSDGSQPIGNGIGALLEMRDILRILQNKPGMPLDLKEKSLKMAAKLLEMGGKAKKGQGYKLAKEILESGRALRKFTEIIEAQGGRVPDEKELSPGRFSYTMTAYNSGRIAHIDSQLIAQVCRAAGTPKDKLAGIYLYKHVDSQVNVGEPILTLYSSNRERLESAVEFLKNIGSDMVVIK
ncbi:MAG: AMP phosphorylase [Candidatus Woesearchaeota archaeon]